MRGIGCVDRGWISGTDIQLGSIGVIASPRGEGRLAERVLGHAI
jgi:hypothetical protein